MSLDFSHAPWADDEVKSLNEYQACDRYHPFTWGDGPDQVNLIATNDGWVAVNDGPVVQTSAYKFMTDWSWSSMNMYP